MCITKIEAYAYDGKTYPKEIDAIIAALCKRASVNEAIARSLIDDSAEIVPLLQRADIITGPQKAMPDDDEKPVDPDNDFVGALAAGLAKKADSRKQPEPENPDDEDNSYSGPSIHKRSELEI